MRPEYREIKYEDYTGPGFRLLFFSDFHLNPFKSEATAKRFIAQMQEAKADLIIFGGDLFTEPADVDPKQLALAKRSLSGLSAPHGIYAVQGNHDVPRTEVKLKYQELMQDLGWQLLEDELVELEDLQVSLLGLKSAYLREPYLPLYSDEVRTAGYFPITVCHEPDYLADKPSVVKQQLLLSGHSHAGQIKLPFDLAPVRPKLGKLFIEGFYRLDSDNRLPRSYRDALRTLAIKDEGTINLDSRLLYVSPGSGCTHLPLRLGASQTYLVLDIKKI
ncbi:MAG: metallophosphoesterase family protein [Eubacteriales bacterium]|nr:metallophosphoesterase family protein [Eubacteriales bacterium]